MIIPMSFSCSGTVDPEDFGVVEGFIVVLVDIEVDPDFGVEGVKSVVLIVVVVVVVVVDVVAVVVVDVVAVVVVGVPGEAQD